jgi:hypothetical protein
MKRGVVEFGEISHLAIAFEERLNRAFRAGTEAEREGVEQRNDIELALSLDEIRCASALAQLIAGKRSLDAINNNRIRRFVCHINHRVSHPSSSGGLQSADSDRVRR